LTDLLSKVLTFYAAGDHEKVIQTVEGLPVEELHYKTLFPIGQAFIQLSRPDQALPYLLRSFYQSPSAKKLIQIKKVAAASEQLEVMNDLVKFILEEHQEELNLISLLAPFTPEINEHNEVPTDDRLLAFYAFADRGRSREAVKIGRQLIADGHESPALRTRMADLLLVTGQIEEAFTLIPQAAEAPSDWKADLGNVLRGQGNRGEVVVISDVTALGDFIQRLTIACKIKANAPYCRVTFCYRPDRGFKDDLARCTIGIDEFLTLDDLSAASIEHTLGSARYRRAILMETDSAFLFGVGPYYGEPWLKIPEEDVASLSDELIAAGVDPDRWFVTTHYRQGNSAPTPHLEPLRDVQSGNFHDVADYIINELGGQVVRLGHPGMDKLPRRKGYIDLSNESIALQLFATARSRFLMGTDSGMVSFAIAFATPTGRTNVTYDIGQENPQDIILVKNLISLEGYAVSSAHCFGEGKSGIALFRVPTDSSFKIFDNTPEQLKVVADQLMERTQDVSGWRTAPPPPLDHEPTIGPFPMNWKRTATVLDLVDMLGLPVREL
jgi:putative glycosyltransferase (TIGR04372 family)